MDLNQKFRAHSTELQNSNPFSETVMIVMVEGDRPLQEAYIAHVCCKNYFIIATPKYVFNTFFGLALTF